MCCLVALLGLICPRVVLFLVWLFNPAFINAAYPNFLVPLLGFIFLPLTTLGLRLGVHLRGWSGQRGRRNRDHHRGAV